VVIEAPDGNCRIFSRGRAKGQMDFVAIDVETANADLASICQIGIAHFSNSVLISQWKSYIDPQDYFDRINVSIHGIVESQVAGTPTRRDLEDH
jgi:DNA polymerase III subunit epsilon